MALLVRPGWSMVLVLVSGLSIWPGSWIVGGSRVVIVRSIVSAVADVAGGPPLMVLRF